MRERQAVDRIPDHFPPAGNGSTREHAPLPSHDSMLRCRLAKACCAAVSAERAALDINIVARAGDKRRFAAGAPIAQAVPLPV
jgi:hypothetical protein